MCDRESEVFSSYSPDNFLYMQKLQAIEEENDLKGLERFLEICKAKGKEVNLNAIHIDLKDLKGILGEQ